MKLIYISENYPQKYVRNTCYCSKWTIVVNPDRQYR